MTIEKRHQQRLSIDLETEVIFRRRSFQTRAQNLSPDGALLQTRHLTAPRGTMVKIRFLLDDIEHQVSGLVVHQKEQKLGVMFQQPQPALFRSAKAGCRRTLVRRPLRPGAHPPGRRRPTPPVERRPG